MRESIPTICLRQTADLRSKLPLDAKNFECMLMTVGGRILSTSVGISYILSDLWWPPATSVLTWANNDFCTFEVSCLALLNAFYRVFLAFLFLEIIDKSVLVVFPYCSQHGEVGWEAHPDSQVIEDNNLLRMIRLAYWTMTINGTI